MMRYFVSLPALRLAVLCLYSTLCLLFAAAPGRADTPKPADPAMAFFVVRGDKLLGCETDCPEWLLAKGRITAQTPALFKKTLKTLAGKKLPVLVLSHGGDVMAAMALGRLIRKNGLSVGVGGTRFSHCGATRPCEPIAEADGTYLGAPSSIGAVCLSACPLVLAAGKTRVAGWGIVGVHQITSKFDSVRIKYRIEYKMRNGKKEIISRKEIGREKREGRTSTALSKPMRKALTAYLKEMQVKSSLIELMLSTTPDKIRPLTPMETAELNLTNQQASAYDLVIARNCTEGRSISECAQAIRSPAPPPIVAELPSAPVAVEPVPLPVVAEALPVAAPPAAALAP